MKMFAIENAALELDITTVRYSKEAVVALAETATAGHPHVIEFDDGQCVVGDIVNGALGQRGPLRLVVGDGVRKRKVWPGANDEKRD